jgi:hypothetical protein
MGISNASNLKCVRSTFRKQVRGRRVVEVVRDDITMNAYQILNMTGHRGDVLREFGADPVSELAVIHFSKWRYLQHQQMRKIMSATSAEEPGAIPAAARQPLIAAWQITPCRVAGIK